MSEKRIESNSSRTAAWTCVSRAASTMESRVQYRSDDFIAPVLIPGFMNILLHVPLFKKIFTRCFTPKGIYEYVIARTKYIDAAYQRALQEGFEQVLIFGAGFDTRALRFPEMAKDTCIYELDVPTTQEAKIGQYLKRGLTTPPNLKFVAIDFDRESLQEKLDAAGFQPNRRSLFLLEGLLMYLQPEAVDETFTVIRDISGTGSRVVFDVIYASVLRQENLYYGESEIYETVSKANEKWQFGIEQGGIAVFLAKYGFKLIKYKDAQALEADYFTDENGRLVGRVNGTHFLITAQKGRS